MIKPSTTIPDHAARRSNEGRLQTDRQPRPVYPAPPSSRDNGHWPRPPAPGGLCGQIPDRQLSSVSAEVAGLCRALWGSQILSMCPCCGWLLSLGHTVRPNVRHSQDHPQWVAAVLALTACWVHSGVPDWSPTGHTDQPPPGTHPGGNQGDSGASPDHPPMLTPS